MAAEASPSPRYVRVANKLVRVAGGGAAAVSPPPRFVRLPGRAHALVNTAVVRARAGPPVAAKRSSPASARRPHTLVVTAAPTGRFVHPLGRPNKLVNTAAAPAARVKHSVRASLAASRGPRVAAAATTTAAQPCTFFNRFGRCERGAACRFLHDPSKVAVCTRFVKGQCFDDKCTLAHRVDKGRMPVCSYFLRGQCSRGDACIYAHVNVSRDAAVCGNFVKGFCPRGTACTMLHVRVCPEFYATGSCTLGDKCRLAHQRDVVPSTASPLTPRLGRRLARAAQGQTQRRVSRIEPLFEEDDDDDGDDDKRTAHADEHGAGYIPLVPESPLGVVRRRARPAGGKPAPIEPNIDDLDDDDGDDDGDDNDSAAAAPDDDGFIPF